MKTILAVLLVIVAACVFATDWPDVLIVGYPRSDAATITNKVGDKLTEQWGMTNTALNREWVNTGFLEYVATNGASTNMVGWMTVDMLKGPALTSNRINDIYVYLDNTNAIVAKVSGTNVESYLLEQGFERTTN
jgi:hypothetical protein